MVDLAYDLFDLSTLLQNCTNSPDIVVILNDQSYSAAQLFYLAGTECVIDIKGETVEKLDKLLQEVYFQC